MSEKQRNSYLRISQGGMMVAETTQTAVETMIHKFWKNTKDETKWPHSFNFCHTTMSTPTPWLGFRVQAFNKHVPSSNRALCIPELSSPWPRLSQGPMRIRSGDAGPEPFPLKPRSSKKQKKSSTPVGPTLLEGQLHRHEPEQFLLPTEQSWTPISRRLSLPLSNFRTRPGGKKSCLFCAADYSQARFLTTPTHTRTE